MHPDRILRHLARDARLAPYLDPQHWQQETTTPDVYRRLLRAICGQQLSVKAAATIWGRFEAHFGGNAPSPADLLDTELATLRALGLSRQKAGYLQNIADYFTTAPTAYEHWSALSDEAIVRELTQIKGVGVWTVEMLLMFALHRPDVLPVGDLGIQQGMQQLYGIETTGKALRTRMVEIAAPWRPYRSYACRTIWRLKDAAKAGAILDTDR